MWMVTQLMKFLYYNQPGSLDPDSLPPNIVAVVNGVAYCGTLSGQLFFGRFWPGFGIGGDYPFTATIMSEYVTKRTGGAFIAAVFAMQGFGILTGGIVSSAFRACFNTPTYQAMLGCGCSDAREIAEFSLKNKIRCRPK